MYTIWRWPQFRRMGPVCGRELLRGLMQQTLTIRTAVRCQNASPLGQSSKLGPGAHAEHQNTMRRDHGVRAKQACRVPESGHGLSPAVSGRGFVVVDQPTEYRST